MLIFTGVICRRYLRNNNKTLLNLQRKFGTIGVVLEILIDRNKHFAVVFTVNIDNFCISKKN